jgi:hypothetical protein
LAAWSEPGGLWASSFAIAVLLGRVMGDLSWKWGMFKSLRVRSREGSMRSLAGLSRHSGSSDSTTSMLHDNMIDRHCSD